MFGPDVAGFPFVGGSGSATSEEQVDILLRSAGNYIVVVHGWQTDGPDANFTLFDWSVPLATGGSLSIDSAPTSATVGSTGTIGPTVQRTRPHRPPGPATPLLTVF